LIKWWHGEYGKSEVRSLDIPSPMATKYASLSPYNYAFNDPAFWNDPMGDDVISSWIDFWRVVSRLWTEIPIDRSGEFHVSLSNSSGHMGFGNYISYALKVTISNDGIFNSKNDPIIGVKSAGIGATYYRLVLPDFSPTNLGKNPMNIVPRKN
jgi:hypothetical protein